MSGIVTWEEVMPLVQVDLPRALFEEKGTRIGNEVHQAFIDALEVPADDRFQIFRPREAGELAVTENYYEDWYAGRLHDA
jgi:hypothetical protein